MNSPLYETVSAVVVTYNSENEIRDIISALNNEKVVSEIIVIDNSSDDNTSDVIKKLQCEKLRLFSLERNIGLAAANNIGICVAQCEFVLISNPDLTFDAGTVENLVSEFKKHDACAIGPINRDIDGTPHSSFHRNWGLMHIILWRAFPPKLVRKLYTLKRKYHSQTVRFISGSFLLAKTQTLKAIGGYDEA